MSPLIPIILSWLFVLVSVLYLLVHLVLLNFLNETVFHIVSIALFFLCVITFWKAFTSMSQKILAGMVSWDDEMKNEIIKFIAVRRVRLISSGIFVSLLFIFHIMLRLIPMTSQLNSVQEIVFYLFLIALFHVSLVSTLIYLKLNRTLSWISLENKLADSELI